MSNENSVNFPNLKTTAASKDIWQRHFRRGFWLFRFRKDWVLIRLRANFCWWKQHQVVNFLVVRICGRFMAWSFFWPAVDLKCIIDRPLSTYFTWNHPDLTRLAGKLRSIVELDDMFSVCLYLFTDMWWSIQVNQAYLATLKLKHGCGLWVIRKYRNLDVAVVAHFMRKLNVTCKLGKTGNMKCSCLTEV